ncbi:TetR/AcrR family transcriptional regulator [Pseudonocardia lacus]|uniref:TetR/AcrR family transcriptional regulator n=1 Tax=Pseudonocardia lacus TaxID=2835865 RepID=UPI001BDC18EE|nr:helix-turn-helix domain-containing protein [Pseudonocardia lacus]
MTYDNSTRAAAAAATRTKVLAAARDAFLARGYAATTIRGIARTAGVSQETVYKRFGNKARLLKDVYDVAMAGDEEAAPVSARPEAVAVRDADSPAEAVAAYAALCRGLTARAGGLMRIVAGARGGDPDLDAFVAAVDAERLKGADLVARLWADRGWLRPGLDSQHARDVIWTLNSPDVWLLLTQRGWSLADYESWIATGLRSMVLRLDR